MLRPGQFGFGARGQPVGPARVVGQLVVPPVAVAVRRVAQHPVHGEAGEGVGAQAVPLAYRDLRLGRGQQQPYGAAPRLHRQAVLTGQERGAVPGRGGQQRSAAAGRVQHARRVGAAARLEKAGHQVGQLGGSAVGAAGGAVLQLPFGQHVQGCLRAFVPHALQQRAQDVCLFGAVADLLRTGQRSRQPVHRVRHLGGHVRIGQPAQLCEVAVRKPGGGEHQRQQPCRVTAVRAQRGAQLLDGIGRGRMAARLQPGPHGVQVVQRAGLGTADRGREVGMPATPVADRGARDPGDPGDLGGGHLGGWLRHVLPDLGSGAAWRALYTAVNDSEHHELI